MAKIIGRNIELGVGVENVRGTPASTAEHWLKKTNVDLFERAEKVVDESTRNKLADSLGQRITKKWVEGEIQGNVHIDPLGYFLYNLYGAVSSVLDSGAVYDHTFTMSESIQHASLALFKKDGANSQEVINNVMLQSFGLEASVDEYVKFTAAVIGQTIAANSDTPSYQATEYDFIGRDITVKFADSSGALGAAPAVPLKEINVNWETGVTPNFVVGDYNPEDIYNTMMSITGDFVLDYDDDTYKDIYMGDTYKYMQITIQGAADLGTSQYPTITITLYRVGLTGWELPDTNELVTQPISFKAFYNESDSKQSQVVIRNLTTEYDTPLTA